MLYRDQRGRPRKAQPSGSVYTAALLITYLPL
jgi:hypothetical protein